MADDTTDFASVTRAMDATVTALRALCADASAALLIGAGTPLDLLGKVFSDSASRDAAKGALAMDSERIDALDTRLRDMVTSGAWTAEQWRDYALGVQDDINAQVGYDADNGGVRALWSTVIVQSGRDLADLAQKAKDALPSTGEVNFLVIAAVVGLGLVLFIKVS
jgi:hypothetical protein